MMAFHVKRHTGCLDAMPGCAIAIDKTLYDLMLSI